MSNALDSFWVTWSPWVRVLGAFTLLAACGCLRVPPVHVGEDRMDFGQVVAESLKRQTLLNVVRLHYADTPEFLDVESIINSYSFGVTGNAGWSLPSHTDPNTFNLGAEGTWSNTPTVTYKPMTGDQFTKSMLLPIPLVSIFQLVQDGWPADLVLGTTIDSINGLRNDSNTTFRDQDFHRLIETIKRIQSEAALAIRVETEEGKSNVNFVLRLDDTSTPTRDDEKLLLKLLKLDEDVTEFDLVYGMAARNHKEVAVISRSMMKLLLLMGADLEVPEGQGTAERVLPFQRKGNRGENAPLVRICSGRAVPTDAYASVSYKGYWYWIDDRDVPSKRVFTFLMILLGVVETNQGGAGPVLTVPSR